MSDDKDVNNERVPESQAEPRRTLPPISSSKPSSGGAKPALPPLSSSRPAGGATRSLSTSVAGASRATSTAVAAVPPPARPVPKETAAPPAQTVPRAQPSPAARKPKQDKPPENDQGIWKMSRKNFLNVAGWFGFFSFLATATLGAIRLMVPRVIYEPPSAFKAGYPDDFVIGEVNEKYKDEYRVWIVREQEGFYALLAICTHLGCTPRWLPSENKFKCPCHGSGYHKDGVNFEGPTPRPLERLKITLADDGQILIDRNIKFLYEKQEWSKPDAFLKYS